MVIIVKNPKLKKEIFSKIRKLENMAIKAYEKGDMKKGKVYDNRSSKLYKDNYSKIFMVKK